MFPLQRLLLAVGLLALFFYPAQSVFALFSSSQAITGNTFSTLQLIAPDTLTAGVQGHDVVLDWNAGQFGDGYALFGAAAGMGGDCDNVTWSLIGQTTETASSDLNWFMPQGSLYCYLVKTTHGSWSSIQNNPATAVRLGFVATAVQIINAGDIASCSGTGTEQYGQTGTLDCGDQIIITFNQSVASATGPDPASTLCADPNTGELALGSTTTTGACATTETIELGTMTGGTIGEGVARYAATYAWSNDDLTVNVTLGARVFGSEYATLSADTWTLNPTTETAKLLSAVGSYHVCDSNADGGNCLPSTEVTELARTEQIAAPNVPELPTLVAGGSIPAHPVPVEPSGCADKPANPVLVGPKENVLVRKGQTVLKWAAAACAVKYTVVITDMATKKQIEKQGGLTALEYPTRNLEPQHTYRWRVIAVNEFGRSRSQGRVMNTR